MAAGVQLPEMGSTAGSIWSAHEQERIGKELMRRLQQAGKLLEDPLITEYVEAVGARLVGSADVLDQPFTFFVVDDPSINAFAAPGGYIGVHTGLIAAAQDEGEMAAVLAHEIAHVTQNHLARAYEDASSMSLPAAAALLGAILLGGADAQLGSAAIAGVAAGTVQRQINFTRDNEREADRIGIQILANAGFDPGDMPEFFERMQRASRYYGTQLPSYLLTHPVTTDRLAEARDRASSLPVRQQVLALEFHLAQARVVARAAEDLDATYQQFHKMSTESQGVVRDAARYGEALLLLRAKRIPAAREAALALQREEPDRLAYRLLLADIEVAASQWKEALTIYADALRLFPGNYPLALGYATTLMQTDQAAKAREFLQEYMRGRAPDAELYRLAARASGEAGRVAEAHGYLAESFHQLGHYGEAIRQLELALKVHDLDLYTRARLESRRNEMRTDMKREKAES
ncbi:MAG: M48 family peptidase [Proteobacteria bacterium]|nr:MAG: M48 family peptidase [Pseudomonadota bacterium]